MNTKIMFIGSVYLTGNKFPCGQDYTRICVTAETQQKACKRIEEHLSKHPYFGLGKIESINIKPINVPDQLTFGVEIFQFIP